jgi:hypothetical protein
MWLSSYPEWLGTGERRLRRDGLLSGRYTCYPKKELMIQIFRASIQFQAIIWQYGCQYIQGPESPHRQIYASLCYNPAISIRKPSIMWGQWVREGVQTCTIIRYVCHLKKLGISINFVITRYGDICKLKAVCQH